jgi:hypothetical protein
MARTRELLVSLLGLMRELVHDYVYLFVGRVRKLM